MDDLGRQELALGLAALAISSAKMGLGEQEAHLRLHQVMGNHGVVAAEMPALLDAAAWGVVEYMPEEMHDPAQIERMEKIRQLVNLKSTEQELTEMLQAREWLQHLAQTTRDAP